MDLQQIGKYQIIGKVGQGAMGEVFKAHDPVLNRAVAIKTMVAALATDPDLIKRFQREAQSAARLNHPNIITVYDFGEEQGRFYLAMEFLEGRDLKDIINRRELPDLEDKLDVMEQICEGLAYAHKQGVVHRDLKPANIHIQPNGQIKIVDFGLAKIGQSTEMTRTGTVMGTPNYMSPEQVRGQKATSRSDVFSLGAVFYELLTQHKAFDAESLHAVLFQVMTNEPEPVRNWVPDIPPVLVKVIETALMKDAGQRYPSAGEMYQALGVVKRVLAGELDEQEGLALVVPIGADDPLAALVGGEGEGDKTRIEPGPGAAGSGSGTPDPYRRPVTPMRGTSSQGTSSPGTPTPGTISGRSVTKVRAPGASRVGGSMTPRPPSRPPAEEFVEGPTPSSKMPLIIGGVLGILALVIVVGFLLLRPQPPPKGSDDVNKKLLLATKVDLARQDFQDHDYQKAIQHADEVLKEDPTNADAKELKQKAAGTLAELDTAANEARSAIQANDFPRAKRALDKVLSISPNHPVAAELANQLDSRFQSEAASARARMETAAQAAEKARATSTESYHRGDSLSREADALMRGGQFTMANQKFIQAEEAYDRARREALERTTPTTTLRAAFTPPPFTPPPATMQPPHTVPPVTQAPVTTPVTQPPVTAPPPTAGGADEEGAVRRVIAEYGRALMQKDLGAFRNIKPNLSGEEEKRLRASFQAIQSWDVNITVRSVDIADGEAKVRLSRKDVVNGKPIDGFDQMVTLGKTGGRWVIKQIGQ